MAAQRDRSSAKLPLKRRFGRLKAYLKQAREDIMVHGDVPGDGLPSRRSRTFHQLGLLARAGISAEQYYLHALWEEDRAEFRSSSYLGILGGWHWQTFVGDMAYACVLDDKLLFDAAARSAGIVVPEILCVYSPTASALGPPVVRCWAELEQWLEAERVEHVFVKPMKGYRGVGAISLGSRISANPVAWERLPQGRSTVTLADLKHLTESVGQGEFVIQRRLAPSTQLAAFAEDVLQTARIVTLADDQAPEVVAAALKIAAGRSPIDNLVGGENLVAPIDIDSGTLGTAIGIENHRQHFCDRHPHTDAPIAGEVIEGWGEAMELTRRAARALPWFKSMGWDVGFTEDGPVIVEANRNADMMLIQVAHRRGLLEWPAYRALFDKYGLKRFIGINGVFG